MSKHTPGPWEVGASGTDIYYPITPDSWVYVASASTRGAGDNDEANAKLIAAAPDMADALQATLHFLETLTVSSIVKLRITDQVASTLAKAGL